MKIDGNSNFDGIFLQAKKNKLMFNGCGSTKDTQRDANVDIGLN